MKSNSNLPWRLHIHGVIYDAIATLFKDQHRVELGRVTAISVGDDRVEVQGKSFALTVPKEALVTSEVLTAEDFITDRAGVRQALNWRGMNKVVNAPFIYAENPNCAFCGHPWRWHEGAVKDSRIAKQYRQPCKLSECRGICTDYVRPEPNPYLLPYQAFVTPGGDIEVYRAGIVNGPSINKDLIWSGLASSRSAAYQAARYSIDVCGGRTPVPADGGRRDTGL